MGEKEHLEAGIQERRDGAWKGGTDYETDLPSFG